MTIEVAKIIERQPTSLIMVLVDGTSRIRLEADAFRVLFGFAAVEGERYEVLAEPVPAWI